LAADKGTRKDPFPNLEDKRFVPVLTEEESGGKKKTRDFGTQTSQQRWLHPFLGTTEKFLIRKKRTAETLLECLEKPQEGKSLIKKKASQKRSALKMVHVLRKGKKRRRKPRGGGVNEIP